MQMCKKIFKLGFWDQLAIKNTLCFIGP